MTPTRWLNRLLAQPCKTGSQRVPLRLEALEDRLAPTGNLAITNAFVVNQNDRPYGAVTAGDLVDIQANFTTTNLPRNASYRIAFEVNGLTLDSSYVTWGAGRSGTSSWYAYWGKFVATPGVNQVTVTLDPDHSVAESSYTDNTFNFSFTAGTPTVGTESTTVAQMRAAYGLNSLPTFGGAVADGTGQTIAIVNLGNDPTVVSDVNTFDQGMSLTTGATPSLYQQYGAASAFLTVYNQSGVNITANLGRSGRNGVPALGPNPGEESMDVEWAHAMAPGAKIDVIEASYDSNWGTNLLAGDALAASLPGVSVVTNSWGLVEWAGETAYDASTFVTPAGHTGVTFLTCSNDNGANAYWTPTPTDGYYPATSPNVVAVGGTQLTLSNNGYGSETGWSYPAPANTVTNGGSGYSQTGTWSATAGGFSGSYGTAPGGSASTAQWTIPISSANTGWGTELSATWTASAGNATNATYTIYNGSPSAGNVLGTVVVDQTQAPAGTAVGGTQFQELGVFFPTLTNGTGTLTVVLNAQSANGTVVADAIGAAQGWASTGGPSSAEAEPAYQAAVQNTGARTTPDVAFDAAFNGGATVVYRGSWDYGAGGTSLGAPCWAGLFAIVNQGRVAAGGTPLNSPTNPQQALQALYSLPASDFHDITSGYNGFTAGAGYDFVTGLGTPIANLLIADLVSYGLPAAPATASPSATSSTSATSGTSGTINAANLTSKHATPSATVLTPASSNPGGAIASGQSGAATASVSHATAMPGSRQSDPMDPDALGTLTFDVAAL